MKSFEQNRVLRTVADVKRLAAKLSECPEVGLSEKEPQEEAWGLADSFAELEKAMRTFLDAQLPKLVDGNLTPVGEFDLLLDIGEQFRGVLYYILEQPNFYKYLLPKQINEVSGDKTCGPSKKKVPSSSTGEPPEKLG